VGAGAVGFDLARTLSRRDHDVVVVERDSERLGELTNTLDCRSLAGNGVDASVLEGIGMTDCELFAAVTDSDETNIIACLTAQKLGAGMRVARVRDSAYYRNGVLALDGIDLAINPDLEAVRSISRILWQSSASDVQDFAGGRVRVVAAKVDAESFVAGRTLADVEKDLGSRWALVITILREGKTLIPRGDTVIETNDQIYLAGARGLVDKALTYVHASGERLGKVMIIGASAMGVGLARDLESLGIKVKLIDRNEERCRLAAEKLHRSLVLHGDGTDVELLQSEGVSEMDGFVAISKDEETNVMACLLAHHNGAGKTICLVNRPDYVPLLPLLGVDAAVSPRLAAADAIARFVKRGAVISTHSLSFSGSEIMQVQIEKGCRCIGRTLAEVEFPRDAVIGAVIKRGRVVTPRGDTVLQAGDEAVVFALPSGLPEVEKFFAAE